MSTALLFSGQGSQYQGMGEKIYNENPSAYEKIFEAGSDILGFDLKNTMFTAEMSELSRTAVSQPVIFTMSLLCAEKFINEGNDFTAVAGHSLGEYAALVISGAVSLETGFGLIKNRAMCMEKAAVKNGGKMAAVMSSDVALIEAICKEVTEGGDYVTPVNYNSKQQTVIAGSESGIAKASEKLTANGVKRVIPLAVAAAFHSEFMKEAAEEFRGLISGVEFKVPEKKFYSNVTGGLLTDFSNIHDILSRHICSPVRFTDELNAMKEAGIDTFVECGPGKTLVGLVKKTLDDVTASAMDA
ncbi:MAG: ACP S-malonyltransferase [Ruminiclostridium sp.]|nr:ACP S-malonyltransferase [Ruminiclostridium sp.]